MLFWVSVKYRIYFLHHLSKLPGAFVIIATPSRIAHSLYDLAENLAATQYGWLICFIASGMHAEHLTLLHMIHYSASVIVSFPPLIGHTTVVTLCGFAFGMKGFWIAAPGALFGAGIVFVLLRFFFDQRLRQWSANHEKWKGLEEVVVCFLSPQLFMVATQDMYIACEGPTSHHTHTCIPISPMGVFQLIIPSQYMHNLPFR